jgi:hypothetical protein
MQLIPHHGEWGADGARVTHAMVRVGYHVVEIHDEFAPAWCSAWLVVVVDTVETLVPAVWLRPDGAARLAEATESIWVTSVRALEGLQP